ncbi:MAG: class I SAM-dependent methyltransferase [Deltaproteobacteria bacterium]|nr:class I SAM-dependent methyltransferase [Deltaproteobacteria bacterium]MBW2359595.1 class I SAM-dependent methyltransferase [Deltaproteobacteria bacterium]
MQCRICAENAWEVVAETRDVRFAPQGADYQIVRCRGCRVMATQAGSNFADPSGHYPAEYGAFSAPAPAAIERARSARHHAPLLPRVALHRFGWLGDLPPQASRRVLEVGCASGKVALALMAAKGWSAVGIEPDPGAAQAARLQGLETHTGTLDDYAGAGDFDVVLFVHVLEHLSDPLAALRRARSLLIPGGHVVVALPNAESLERRLFGNAWDGWDVPRHLHHFGPATLCGLLERAGLVPGPVRHEWYSLLARSVGNCRRAQLPHAERGRGWALRVLELPWGFTLAACHTSSAIQVVARVA